MSMHYHIDKGVLAHYYHGFIGWEHRHSHQLMIAVTAVILVLLAIIVFLWVNQQGRIQIYDPLQLDDLFYPYMLSLK